MKIVKSTTSTKYIINGKEYGSLEEMPEAERQLFVAAQHVMESPDQAGPVKTNEVLIEDKFGVKKYVVNGREYHSLEEVPEAERRLIEETGGSLGPAEALESAQSKDFRLEEKRLLFGPGPIEANPARWTVTLTLGTLFWILTGLAVAIVAVLLIIKGSQH